MGAIAIFETRIGGIPRDRTALRWTTRLRGVQAENSFRDIPQWNRDADAQNVRSSARVDSVSARSRMPESGHGIGVGTRGPVAIVQPQRVYTAAFGKPRGFRPAQKIRGSVACAIQALLHDADQRLNKGPRASHQDPLHNPQYSLWQRSRAWENRRLHRPTEERRNRIKETLRVL